MAARGKMPRVRSEMARIVREDRDTMRKLAKHLYVILVHGFQAREIRVHVGSAPLNGRGRNKNSYQEGCAGCVTSDR